jgi:hypothetical protein
LVDSATAGAATGWYFINSVIQQSIHRVCLALPLFVASVRANHPDDALAPNDFAVFTKFFN